MWAVVPSPKKCFATSVSVYYVANIHDIRNSVLAVIPPKNVIYQFSVSWFEVSNHT